MHRFAFRCWLILACALFIGAPAQAQFGGKDAELHKLAGSMIVTGFQGDDVGDAGFLHVYGQLKKGHVGGVIFFKDNIANPEQAQALNRALKIASGRKNPLPILAIDEEGGRVQRLKAFDAPKPIDTVNQSPEARAAVFAGLAQSLAEAEFTLNLAPVVDLDSDVSPVIGRFGRAFSDDPDQVSTIATEMIEAHRAVGLGTSLKHFPGHGLARADSHLGFVDVTDTWSSQELVPFLNLIRAGRADAIMTAHIFNASLDPSHPATLSQPTITGLLRDKLDFEGVVISDDLTMDAIDESYSLEDAVLLAVDAGVDILLTGNFNVREQDEAELIREILVQAVKDGRLSRARLQESHDRILALRQRFR